MLITKTDIFGFHPNTFQGADRLAQRLGYQIVIPDLFRGRGWETSDMPPKEGREKMQAYIQSIGAWEVIRSDLRATVTWLERKGRTDIGVCISLFSFWVLGI